MYKVLIIDDEPWSREVVKALGKWNELQLSIVGEAEDGLEGLKLAGELQPHIVITDMRMPGLDGVKFLQTMSSQFPSLKIIVMSGYNDFVYLKQAIRSKALEYLLKPINPDELNASLAQCVRELTQTQIKVNMSLRTPLSFTSSTDMERYLSYRQRILGFLMELNKSSVQMTFEKLQAFLESISSEILDETLLTKICHDFILILEEFVSKNNMSFDHIWHDGRKGWAVSVGWNSIPEAVRDISQLYGEAIDAIEAYLKNRNRLDLKEVCTYIDRHFQGPISLETIAQHFFISKEHLSRVFKTYSGENVSDYIIRRRMEKACDLIMNDGLQIKLAAEMCGYTELAYFYRVFKKYFGITPGELRKEE